MRTIAIMIALSALLFAAGCKKNVEPARPNAQYAKDDRYCKHWAATQYRNQSGQDVTVRKGKDTGKGALDDKFGLTRQQYYERCMRKRGWSDGRW